MREEELKRRERLRLGWTVSLTVLAVLCSAIGTAKAGSKMTSAQIQRAVELRIATRKCAQTVSQIQQARPGVRQSKVLKACAPLLLKGPCRSAFARGEKALSVCLDAYCGALTRTERTKECNDSEKASGETAETLADKKLCKRRARVKKKTVVEALLKRRIVAELGKFMPASKAKALAGLVIGALPRHINVISLKVDNPQLHVTPGRTWQLFIKTDGRTTRVSAGKSWSFKGQPTPRALDAMIKEFTAMANEQGGVKDVRIMGDRKVSYKFVTSLTDALNRSGIKNVVFVSP